MLIFRLKVRSLSNGQISVVFPEKNFKRTFEKKGSIKLFPYDVLEEGIWDSGFSYMLRNGLLEIMDKDAAKALGFLMTGDLEEYKKAKESYEVEAVVFSLDDKQKKRYLTVAPISELKEVLSRLSDDQRKDLAQFAIDNEIVDYERAKVIKKVTGIDIPRSVDMKH